MERFGRGGKYCGGEGKGSGSAGRERVRCTGRRCDFVQAFGVKKSGEWRPQGRVQKESTRKSQREERIAVWMLVLAVELVHGTLRWIFLRPRVGDFRSGQIGVFTGSVLFLVI